MARRPPRNQSPAAKAISAAPRDVPGAILSDIGFDLGAIGVTSPKALRMTG